ncbi:MAG: TIGR03790 family protein [Planctomycetota bacterium]
MQRFFDQTFKTPPARLLLFCALLIVFSAQSVSALEPDEILVVANGNNPASMRVANHYCEKRNVPKENILKLTLNREPADDITRSRYDKLIAHPVRIKLAEPGFSGRIKCLLTVYSVPFRVGARGRLKGEKENLDELNKLARSKTVRLKEIIRQLEITSDLQYAVLADPEKPPTAKKILKYLDSYIQKTYSRIDAVGDKAQKHRHLRKWLDLYADIYGKTNALAKVKTVSGLSMRLTEAEQGTIRKCRKIFDQARKEEWGFKKKLEAGFYDAVQKAAGAGGVLLRLNADIDNIRGAETGASVDSELSMVLFDDYELYRWMPNELKHRLFWTDTKTLMVSRLDGPTEDIAVGLVDKAISAERNGLKGFAYIDSGYSKKKKKPLYLEYDQSLLKAASLISAQTQIKVIQEQTAKLFASGECPNAALYCGWYSLKKYVDAFDFVDGAVGYHIASWEAIDLRDPLSKQWCPAMLTDGITATMGAVAEPYLAAFPKPDLFFSYLINGRCLAEAFYRTKPYNSWQMLLIGDPLYRPF